MSRSGFALGGIGGFACGVWVWVDRERMVEAMVWC